MSLMEYCDVRDGVLVPDYKEALCPIRCDRCRADVPSVALKGLRWVCPLCHEETQK